MKTVKIGAREVGDGQSVFVIAEAGSNHNRDFNQAKKLIDVAAQAGADAVKFQTFSAETLYSKKTPSMSYLTKGGLLKEGETVFDLLKKNELPREWQKDLAAYCREKGVIFLSTPFDLKAVDELEKLNVPAYKIASYEITHLPLLEHAAKTGKPMIVSTGMADLTDIEQALDVIYATGNRQVILLHCAINYPPKFEDVHLRAMKTMREAFQVPVGFSDHTTGIAVDLAAAALGACAIEKHYTTDRKLPGPDHPFAIEPQELKAMVQGIREVEKALGSPVKRRTAAEEEMYKLGRRSLVAARKISKGTQITREMIEVKRPGFGIPTKEMHAIVGRTAKVDIDEDDILVWDMFS
ncbi:MAG TPA: N-acetylneuraminate synthase [Verrucomicrobiae bacterium]|nr:N-acetylneuraminate synthase [Verrucomicrobiae bacterium]